MSEQQDFFDNLKVIENDPITGNIIMEHKETGQRFGLKEIVIDEGRYEETLLYLSEREKLNSKYIINLYTTIQQYQNDRLAIIFENWVLNFHDQLESRCRTDQFWSEEELVNTLETTVQAVLTLHENGIYHGNLSTKSIVFCEDNNVKLIDQFVFTQQYALEDPQTIKKNFQHFQHFLEPQLLLEDDLNEEISNSNIENDLWAVGLIFLQAACLEPSIQLYDYPNRQFNFDLLDSRLDFVKNKYSLQFVSFLAQLLSLDRNQRILFINKIQSIDEFNLYHIFDQNLNDPNLLPYNQLQENNSVQEKNNNLQSQDITNILENCLQKSSNIIASNLQINQMPPIQILSDFYQNCLHYGKLDEKNKKQGFGILKNQNNIVIYSGQFQDDQLHGIGKLINEEIIDLNLQTHQNINLQEIIMNNYWVEIEGSFKNNKINGQAQIKYLNNYFLYANFINNQVEGVCSLLYNNQYSIVLIQDGSILKTHQINL